MKLYLTLPEVDHNPADGEYQRRCKVMIKGDVKLDMHINESKKVFEFDETDSVRPNKEFRVDVFVGNELTPISEVLTIQSEYSGSVVCQNPYFTISTEKDFDKPKPKTFKLVNDFKVKDKVDEKL